MHWRTRSAIVVLVLALAGVAYLGATPSTSPGLTVEWVSETGDRVPVNHHAVASDADSGLVFAPISGEANSTDCGLYAIATDSGTTRWTYEIPPRACAVHGIADPTVTDYDDDGQPEVIVATNENLLVALSSADGSVEFRKQLANYGYTSPLVTAFTAEGDRGGDDRSEGNRTIVVVDVSGTVTVFDRQGERVWETELNSTVFGQPAVVDGDGDGAGELLVGLGTGDVVFLERDGRVSATVSVGGSVTWLTTAQLDPDDRVEVVTATSGGTVTQLDASGVAWQRDLGEFAAVHAVADGDRDGRTEVYATARDGRLRSLDGRTGAIEWETTLTTADVQMMPPPVFGDVDGDGRREIVAVTNDGTVAIVDPDSGEVRSTFERDVQIFVRPTLADVDDDGVVEVLVVYADGRIIALSGS